MYPTLLMPEPGLTIPRSPAAGRVIWVDGHNGSDDHSGYSPEDAKESIQAAITLANTFVPWDPNGEFISYIMVLPCADFVENLTPPYWCEIIGLGIRGTDTMVSLRPASGSEITGTFLGTVLKNLRFIHLEASHPILDLGICNNSHIEECEFTLGADVAGVAAIDTENSTHLTVRKCDFQSLMAVNRLAYAIYARGGADKFFAAARIEKNNIFAQTCGIYIADNCTAAASIAKKNVIEVLGTGTGIDGFGGGADTGSELLAVKNYISIIGAGDAIHGLADGKKLHNETNVNGTFAYEKA